MFSTNVCGYTKGICLNTSMQTEYIYYLRNGLSVYYISHPNVQLSRAEGSFRNWVGEVEQLHNSNEWLLFFRIPKLTVLYETLTSEKCDVAMIQQEIGFLFQRDVATRQKLHAAIEVRCCDT